MKNLKLVVTVFCLALTATASEIADVRTRISATNYPLPPTTIERMHDIQRELTPAATGKSARVLRTRRNYFCDTETIRISYRLKDDSEVAFFNATFTYPHRSALFQRLITARRYPAVVIQPTLAGPTGLEKKIAWDLCLAGIASLVPNETILDLPAALPDFKAYDRNLRIEMIRARRMVDFLESHPKVDKSNIGAIGFSRGAIAGALLIGIEPRIKSAFLGAGGVGFAKIIAGSQTEKGRSDNARQMQAAGLNQGDFEKALLENIQYDAILFGHRFNPARLKLMIVRKDDNVSTQSQELLRRTFGNPQVTYKTHGHVGSIVRQVFFEGSEYLNFFKSQFH